MRVKRALISVSDKVHITEFAKELESLGIEILSTGGTYSMLLNQQIRATEVSAYTGFPEIMNGRVKTLHPKIYGGILARRDQDHSVMDDHGIFPIDLVVVNLYPFQSTISNPECTFEEAIENIDIGGPAMIRAAAKNNSHVIVVVDPNDYQQVLERLHNKTLSDEYRLKLAHKAFAHTSEYDTAISRYLNQKLSSPNEATNSIYPDIWQPRWIKVKDLRYGENPHQSAAFYREDMNSECYEANVSHSSQLQGKILSFNNIADTDAALECVKQFDSPACVIVKHANPCGVAIGKDLIEAYNQAYLTDPTSAFGGVIAFNKTLEQELAETILNRQFAEVVIAPTVSEKAKKTFSRKENIRLLECGPITKKISESYDLKRVSGGLLVQTPDCFITTQENLKVVTKIKPTMAQLDDLLFAWKVAKFVKSNAIVFAKDQRTIGVGAGQMSRVYSAKIACIKAGDEGLEIKGSVMASDAFFPFRDGIDTAAEAGVSAIIQPGGSIRDEEIIQAADETGIAMVFTNIRHFRH